MREGQLEGLGRAVPQEGSSARRASVEVCGLLSGNEAAPPGEWSQRGRKARGKELCRAPSWGVSAWLWTGGTKGMSDQMLLSVGAECSVSSPDNPRTQGVPFFVFFCTLLLQVPVS